MSGLGIIACIAGGVCVGIAWSSKDRWLALVGVALFIIGIVIP